MRKPYCVLSIASCALCLGAAAASPAHVRETLTLQNGWNAVYLESTPEESDPDAFFADLAATSAAEYVSDAYDDTEQYDSDGNLREQKPVSYRLWVRNGRSALTSLSGGRAYLVFATNDCSKTFYGVPCAPSFTWRKASAKDDDSLVNLIGVSLAPGAKMSAAAYFGEGPYGPSGTMYTVGGTGEAPTFKAPFTSGSAKVESGRAYGATAVSSGSWPGVLAVSASAADGGVRFDAGANKAAVRISNRGTTNRTVRVTYSPGEKSGEAANLLPMSRRVSVADSLATTWTNVVAGESWELEVDPDETEEIVFGIVRTSLDRAKSYGGILSFEDLGGTQMRVRIPVGVEHATAGSAEAEYPTGLWIGKFQISKVAYGTNTPPVAAEGTLKPTVLFFVDENRKMTMLQRVSVVQTNGETRLFRDFAKAKSASDSARRLSSLILDPANRSVDGTGAGFGETAAFTYAVEPKSSGNPFYHLWHPDHDGLNSTYSADANWGTELWSVTNTVTVQFRDSETSQAYYSSGEDEISAGRVLWRVDGLRSLPVSAEGVFSIQRILPVSKLEE